MVDQIAGSCRGSWRDMFGLVRFVRESGCNVLRGMTASLTWEERQIEMNKLKPVIIVMTSPYPVRRSPTTSRGDIAQIHPSLVCMGKSWVNEIQRDRDQCYEGAFASTTDDMRCSAFELEKVTSWRPLRRAGHCFFTFCITTSINPPLVTNQLLCCRASIS